MFIVHVFIHVKPERLDEFRLETLSNVKNSLMELGIARFDFLEETDDPHRFMLVEVYRTPEDALQHKETVHYRAWRDRVAPMMASPRTSIKLANIHPDDAGWTP
jgi:autoinducer 2-degrading protein